MANKTDIAFEIKINTVQSYNNIKDLKEGLKVLKNELLGLDAGSENFKKLSKVINETEGKLGDLNDSFGTLTGSGIERTNSSLGLLKEGFANFDFDKIKIAFKGLGSAMGAVPLLLMVQGIQYLIEKFGIIEMVIEAVTKVFFALTDAMGFTQKAAEAKTKSIIEGLQKEQKAVTERYDSEIALAKASGKQTADLEIAKLKAVEDSVQKQYNALVELSIKKGKLNDDEQKQYQQLQSDLLKASTDRRSKEIEEENKRLQIMRENNKTFSDVINKINLDGMSARERELADVKQKTQERLKELEKIATKVVDSEEQYLAAKKAKDEILKEEQKQTYDIMNKYHKEYIDKKNAADQKYNDEFSKRLDLTVQSQIENEARANQALIDAKKEQLEALNKSALEGEAQYQSDSYQQQQDADRAEEIANAESQQRMLGVKKDFAKQSIGVTVQALNATQQLTDLYFGFLLKKNKDNAQKEKEIKKKQFEVDKAFKVASIILNTIQSITQAISSSPPPLSWVLAGINSAMGTAATIAALAQKFDDGGAGGGDNSASVGSIGASASAPPPTISTPQNTPPNITNFDANGKNQNLPTLKVVNVETESRAVSTRVKRLESQAVF